MSAAAARERDAALSALRGLGRAAEPLRALAAYVVARASEAGTERRQAARDGSRAGAHLGRAPAAARANDRSAAKSGEHRTGPQRP